MPGPRPLLALAVAALALGVAGCGGDDESSSATQEWADGFCTSVTAWTDSLQAVGDSLTDTSNLNADGITEAVDETVEATKQFVDDVKALGSPDTESGAETQAALEGLADQLDASVQTLEDEFSGGVDSLTDALSKVATVTGALAEMAGDVQSTFAELDEIDARGELSDVLEQTDSCSSFAQS